MLAVRLRIVWPDIQGSGADLPRRHPEYSQAARKAHQTPSLAWVAWTDATFDLSVDLREDNSVILEEPGHFIVATGLEGDTYRISDPAYERATLDVPEYGNQFLSARRYAVSEDGAAIMVAAPEGVQILVTDPDGNGPFNPPRRQPRIVVAQSMLCSAPKR